MNGVDIGDGIRIDIPDETDLDHQFNGKNGAVREILVDDAGAATGGRWI
jgi:hypothetical protein